MTDRKLSPVPRDEVVAAIQHGMLYDGRKRTHYWDRINAQVAAEKLADYLARANLVVMRGPPAPSHTGGSGPIGHEAAKTSAEGDKGPDAG